MEAFGIVNEPARVTANTSSLKDNVFTNIINCKSIVEECTFSDHSVVFFEINKVGKTFNNFDTAIFRDGTGRTGRMSTNLVMLMENLMPF